MSKKKNKRKFGKLSKTENLLLGYSEWLDDLMKPPDDDDCRTHLDLVREYLGEDKPKPLAVAA